jgi:hypothetical protein
MRKSVSHSHAAPFVPITFGRFYALSGGYSRILGVLLPMDSTRFTGTTL